MPDSEDIRIIRDESKEGWLEGWTEVARCASEREMGFAGTLLSDDVRTPLANAEPTANPSGNSSSSSSDVVVVDIHDKESDEVGAHGDGDGNEKSGHHHHPHREDTEEILVSMGFTREQVQTALLAARGNADLAVSILTSDSDTHRTTDQ